MLFATVPLPNQEMESLDCTAPPAFDPSHQECVGGRNLTYDAPYCPGDTVRRHCFLPSFSLTLWLFTWKLRLRHGFN